MSSTVKRMVSRNSAARRSIELAVPAHVAFERYCRIDDHALFRPGVLDATALTETRYRWELAGGGVTTTLTDRRPDELLRWRSVDGPPYEETTQIRALSPRRCRLSVSAFGPTDLLAVLAVDLAEFRRVVERDHPDAGHHANERPDDGRPHPSNWRDSRLVRPARQNYERRSP